MLENIETYLLDMDGTIYLGDTLIDGAYEFLETLKKQDKKFIFLTNNSSKSRLIYVEKLRKLGIEVTEDDVFTSGEATTIYLNTFKTHARVFLLGNDALREEFNEAGFILVDEAARDIDYVVLGFDTSLSYEKLWKACDYIRDGVEYIATHPDFNCPLAGGKFMPDAGAMIEFIYASTGKKPYVVGKPNPAIIESICNKYGLDKSGIAMVGDRLYTDIKTGENAGISSILVYSGETSKEDYAKSEIKATYQFDSIKEINEVLVV